jgi:AraC-like DNA-binding protein
MMLEPCPALAPKPPAPADVSSPGAPAGSDGGVGARPLFGDIRTLGFSFEWYDFETEEELDWSRRFHSGSVELCLNLEGRATLADGRQTVELHPRASIFYFQGAPSVMAKRRANERHRFITVAFTAKFLKKHLKRECRHLRPCIQALIAQSAGQSVVTAPEPMRVSLLQLGESLLHCPVFKPAQETWFRSKALQLAAQFFFRPPDEALFCLRRQHAACERAARTREILRQRLADPPKLDELGRLVGCCPFYLSRQFSETTGLTIPQFLRQARLERAADLLRTGKYNVTEAALAVGYNSLSHFTVAFREMFGCCPGLYPLKVQPATAANEAGPEAQSPVS